MKTKTRNYLSIQEYATRYSLHIRTVERWIRDGKIQVIKSGWAVKIAEDEKPKGIR